MDLALFESFYRRVGGEIDFTGVSFGEYNDSETSYDTAMIRNGELNGPRRYIWSPNGNIVTRTYKDNKKHGLLIWVESDRIEVYVYREESWIFRIHFTTSGQETHRRDYENSFTDVTPSMFLK